MIRTIIRWTLRVIVPLLLVALVGAGIWWFTRPPAPVSTHIAYSESRSRKLLALAASDASKIEEVDPRLTRVLNLADAQIRSKWKSDAVETLRLASKTLASEDARKLSSHARISGWISVSELARLAGDSAGGIAACDAAVTAVRDIEDPAIRCRYVIGVANQLQYLRGKEPAAAILAESGDWMVAIDDISQRRAITRDFASALFNLDRYDLGADMLAHETDANWRSTTLMDLSQQARETRTDVRQVLAQSVFAPSAAMAPAKARQAESLPLSVNFQDVFQGQSRSQTVADPVRSRDASQP